MVSANISRPSIQYPARPSPFHKRNFWIFLFFLLSGWALAQTGILERDLINERGWRLFARFLNASVQPELSPDFLRLAFESALQTLGYAALGVTLSLIIGAIGGLLGSEILWETLLSSTRRNFTHLPTFRLPWLLLRIMLTIPRAIHEIIWGLFFLNIFGLNPLTAILAIGIHFGAITAKVFSEILDETPREAFIALKNSGTPSFSALLYGLLSLAFPNLLAYSFYRFECAIRASAILGIIGAGGLGHQIFLSLQSLRYEELWTLFYALILLSGLIDFWSSWLRRAINANHKTNICIDDSCVNPQIAPVNEHHRVNHHRNPVIRISIILAIFLVVFSFWYIRIDFSRIFEPRTAQLFETIIANSFPPRLGGEQIGELFRLSLQTLAMSILAMVIAAIGGIIFSFPAANNFLLPGGVMNGNENDRRQWVIGSAILLLARGILLLFRSIPAPIWALVILFVFFPGILPGALALGIYTMGILGRLMAEITENLDPRPLRALKAQGASGAQVFLYGVLPRALPHYMSYILYRWEVAIRATVIVGLVGAGGLGRLLTEQLSAFDYRGVTATLIFFIGLTFLVDLISSSIRRSLR